MAARKTLGRSPLQFLSLGKRTMAKEKTTTTNQQDGQHKNCPNTVFVSNFPYSFTNSQAPPLSLYMFLYIYMTHIMMYSVWTCVLVLNVFLCWKLWYFSWKKHSVKSAQLDDALWLRKKVVSFSSNLVVRVQFFEMVSFHVWLVLIEGKTDKKRKEIAMWWARKLIVKANKWLAKCWFMFSVFFGLLGFVNEALF